MELNDIGILSYILLSLIVLILSIVIKNTNKLLKQIPNLVTEQKILNEKISNTIDKITEIQTINEYKLKQYDFKFENFDKKIEKIEKILN